MQQLLEDAFDSLAAQIWMANQSGSLTFVNAFTAQYFEMSKGQLIGESWQNVLHSADLATAVERWTRSIQTEDRYQVDFRLLRGSDRTYRRHHASARLTRIGGASTWIGSNIDVDADKRTDEVLQAWRQQLSSPSDVE